MRDNPMPQPALLHDESGEIFEPLQLGDVKLYPAPALSRIVLRARPQGLHLMAQTLGISPPDPLRASSFKDHHLLWQGPDEWLLLAPYDENEDIKARIADAMASHVHALVDVSHRHHAFLLTGKSVENLLSCHCMLDLSLQAFPVAMTTRTLFAKAELTLWRIDEHTFHIELWRSYAAYVIGLLREGADTLPD